MAERVAQTREGLRTVALFLVIFLLSFIASWVPSFWYDEAATLRLARLPADEFLAFVSTRDAVHAVYAAFMHAWIGVFGESELSVRLPSVLAASASAIGVYALARRWGGRGAGLGAAVIFAFLPRTLIQGIEARSFSIATLLIVLAAVLIVRAAEREQLLWWIGYLIVILAAIWIYAFAILVTPAFAILADRADRSRRARMGRAAVLLAIPALLATPLFLMLLQQRGQVAWLSEQPLNPYTALVEPFFGNAVWLLVAVIALLGWAIWRRTLTWSRHTVALLVWLALPLAVLVTVSIVTQPVFAARYLSMSSPALAIFCGLAMRRWRTRAVLAFAIAWMLAVLPFAVGTRVPTAKPGGVNFRAITAEIASNAMPGDGFILQNTGTGALRPRTAIAAYPAGFANLRDLAYVDSFVTTGTFWDTTKTPTPADLARLERVWLASRPGSDLPQLLTKAGFREQSTSTITGVVVSRWQRETTRERHGS